MSSDSPEAASGAGTTAAEHLPYARDSDLPALLERSGAEPVLLYFSTTWCGPCKVFGPQLERYFNRNPARSAFKVDGDESPQLDEHFDVHSYPTAVVIRAGSVQWHHSGVLPEDELADILDAVLATASDAQPQPHTAAPELTFPLTLQFPAAVPGGVDVELHTGNPPKITPLGADGPCEVTLDKGDRIFLQAGADERRRPALDLSALRTLPPAAPYHMLYVTARNLPAGQLSHITALAHVDQVWLTAAEPLDDAALAAVAAARTDVVRIDAPGFDADRLIALRPGLQVNGMARSAAVGAALTATRRATPAEIAWTTPDRLAGIVATGATVLAMIQAEHPAERAVAASWHDAVAAGELAGAHTVSAYGDEQLIRTVAPEPRRPALVAFRDGVPAWRTDLPAEPADLHDLRLDRLLAGLPRPERALRAPAVHGERTISLPSQCEGEVLSIELVPPATVSRGARFVLTHGRQEQVPAGWTVHAWRQIVSIPDIPYAALSAADVQDLSLQVVKGHDQVDLAGLRELPALERLSLDIGPLFDAALDTVLPEMARLLSLRLVHATEAQLARARQLLPDTVVNGSWRGYAEGPTAPSTEETA